MTLDLDDLKSKAKAAHDLAVLYENPWNETVECLPEGFTIEDREYVAAASPDVVLSIIERIETMESEMRKAIKLSLSHSDYRLYADEYFCRALKAGEGESK